MTRPSFILYFITAWLTHRGFSQEPENWSTAGRTANGATIGIHCEGHYPPGTQYLLQAEHNQYFDSPGLGGNYWDLLSVCARTDWGGSMVNAGALCLPLSPTPDEVIFDKSERPFSAIHRDLRLALYCRTHCWCTGGHRGTINATPRQIPQTPIINYYYVLDTDLSVWSPIYLPFALQTMKFAPVDYISWSAAPYTVMARHQITGPSRNRISCFGPVAPFPNHPYGPLVYDSLQKLCAAALYGGSIRGNFGGICSTSKGYQEVEFADEFAHPRSRVNMATHIYCFVHCRCPDSPPKGLREIYGFLIDEVSDDTIIYRFNDRTQRPVGRLEIEPSTDGTVSIVSYRCSLGPGNSCLPQPLDDTCKYGSCLFPQLHLESPVNSRVVNLNPIVGPLKRPKHDRPPAFPAMAESQEIPPDTCSSSRCTGPGSCGDSCVCRVGSAYATVQQVGLDRLFANAICTLKLLTSFDVPSDMGKRDREFTQGAAGACVCNTTYVSTSCCNSQNGLVWEAPDLKLGMLAIQV